MTPPYLLCDGYKLSHRDQYPAGTTRVYSNWTARGSRTNADSTVFFGLQAFCQWYEQKWRDEFFDQDIASVRHRYERRVRAYTGPGTESSDHLVALHELGYLPLRFRALPEGTRVPLRVPAMTVENTHDGFAWLTNYAETALSAWLWPACTSATTAAEYRRVFARYAAETGVPEWWPDWQGHDFSMRGLMGTEAAAISGAGHLVSFRGTDTLPAIDFAEDYYGVWTSGHVLGGSVPATEHSVMCAGGRENEPATYRRLLTTYPTGIVSVVSDTWDLWNVLTTVLPSMRAEIMARNGKLVVRPDSGDPELILCGDPFASEEAPRKGVVRLLADAFETVSTSTGHKSLDPHVGAIYGDAITLKRARSILGNLAGQGFASDVTVFGIGSYTYQGVTRDTYGHAIKSTAVVVDGEDRQIFKDPVTDDGLKRSARGRIAVVRTSDGALALRDGLRLGETVDGDLLEDVWADGYAVRHQTFDDVRRRAGGPL